jgi:hypothetical protein
MRNHSTLWSVVTVALFAASMAVAATGAQNDEKAFLDRVQKYVDLQKKAEGSVPSLKKDEKDSAVIAKHEDQLADAIRKLRPNAMPGEVFTPGVRQMLAGVVKSQVQGQAGKDAKQTIVGEGNPKSDKSSAPVVLKVNATYSSTAPFSTVPPSVLMALPTLPKEIEYRFVGHTLILRDTKANIIVDILPNAF